MEGMKMVIKALDLDVAPPSTELLAARRHILDLLEGWTSRRPGSVCSPRSNGMPPANRTSLLLQEARLFQVRVIQALGLNEIDNRYVSAHSLTFNPPNLRWRELN